MGGQSSSEGTPPLPPSSPTVIANVISDNVIENAIGPNSYGILISQYPNVRVINNTITSVGHSGIFGSTAHDCDVSRNRVVNAARFGILISGPSLRPVVKDNIIWQWATLASSAGISVNNAVGGVVQGNSFYFDNTTTVEPAAVRVEAGSFLVVVANNTLLYAPKMNYPFVNLSSSANRGTFTVAEGVPAITVTNALATSNSRIVVTQVTGLPTTFTISPGLGYFTVTLGAPSLPRGVDVQLRATTMRWIARLGFGSREAPWRPPIGVTRACVLKLVRGWDGWPLAGVVAFPDSLTQPSACSGGVPMNVGRNNSEAHGCSLVGEWPCLRVLSLIFFVLVCVAARSTAGNGQAEGVPRLAAAASNPGGPPATSSPERALSGDPTVVTIEPELIPNFRAHRTDITDALQSVIDSTSGPLKVVIPPGYFVVQKGNIRITRDPVQIEGAGSDQTILDFMPDSGGGGKGQTALFVFQKPDRSTLSGAGISDCSIVSGEVSLLGLKEGVDQYAPKVQSPQRKVAIRLVNTSLFRAKDVSISGWWGGGEDGGSIGLQIQGRECARIEGLFIEADTPIRIEPNGDPGMRGIGIDHFHFSDLFLIASGGQSVRSHPPGHPLDEHDV